MTIRDEQRALVLLEALYDLARADIHADRATLAEWSGLDRTEVDVLLRALDAQQLARTEPCRLTMAGLVLAVSRCGSRKVAKDAA